MEDKTSSVLFLTQFRNGCLPIGSKSQQQESQQLMINASASIWSPGSTAHPETTQGRQSCLIQTQTACWCLEIQGHDWWTGWWMMFRVKFAGKSSLPILSRLQLHCLTHTLVWRVQDVMTNSALRAKIQLFEEWETDARTKIQSWFYHRKGREKCTLRNVLITQNENYSCVVNGICTVPM